MTADPLVGAQVLGPTEGDVEFVSPDDVLAAAESVDLGSVGTLLVARGPWQVDVVRILLDHCLAQGASPDRFIVEMGREWKASEVDAFSALRTSNRSDATLPELTFRVDPTSDLTSLVEARSDSQALRLQGPAEGGAWDTESSPGATRAPVAALERRVARLRKVSERRREQVKRLRKRVARLEELRGRESRLRVGRDWSDWLGRRRYRLGAVAGLILLAGAAAGVVWAGALAGPYPLLVGVSLALVMVLTTAAIALLAILVKISRQLVLRDRRHEEHQRRLLRQQVARLSKVVAREKETAATIRAARAKLGTTADVFRRAADQHRTLLRHQDDQGVESKRAHVDATRLGDQLRDLGESLASQHDRLWSEVRAVEQRGNAARTRQTAHLESVANLLHITPTSSPAPLLGGWAASADLISFLVRELARLRPSLVVECGSGASTLWFALTIQRLQLDTRVVALEHSPRFIEETRRVLRDHGVEHLVELRLAPVEDVTVNGVATRWYAPAALDGLVDVGLLLVDGPPSTEHPLTRYPAVPLMHSALAAHCVVVLDDLVRDEEKQVAQMWAEDELAAFTHETLNLEKGAAVFRRGDA